MKKILLLCFLIVLIAQKSFSLHTFIGTEDDQWDNAANWDMGTLPTSSDDVAINSSCLVPTVTIPLGYTLTILDITIDDGKELTVMVESSLTAGQIILQKGTLNNNGYIYARQMRLGTLVADEIGIVNNNSNIELSNGAPNYILLTRGTFNNHDVINGTGFSANEIFIEVLADGIFNNYGDVNKSSTTGEIINNKGIFLNEVGANLNFTPTGYPAFSGSAISSRSGGVLTNKGNIHLSRVGGQFIPIGIFVQGTNSFINETTGVISIFDTKNDPIQISASSDFINKGSLYLEKGAFGGNMIIGHSATCVFTNTSTGTLSGEGEITVDNFIFEGTFSPGNSPGKVEIDTDFDFNNVTYIAEIEGTSGAGVTGGNDLIEVTGTADLAGGTLNVNLLGGFSPVLGNQFTIITATTSVTGTFATTSLPPLSASLTWDINYNATSVVLEIILDPLPVELSSFQVLEKSNYHLLNWTTESESKASHFEIEYSLDGFDWKKVGRVTAHGESNSIKNYSFEQSWNADFSQHYYRLKIIDLDNTFEYSDIQSIRSTTFSEVKVFPNPFSTHVQIDLLDSKFEILNVQNQVVYQANSSNENLDLSHFPNGFYFIKYQLDGQPILHKIIKVNQ